MTPRKYKTTIAPGDLVKITLDGKHFEIGMVVEQEQDQAGFWHVFSRGHMHLIADWDMMLLEML